MFTNNLEMYRKALGFSQKEIADSLGVSRETYSRLECGHNLPNLANADFLARKYSTTIYNLWPCLLSTEDYKRSIEENRADEREKVQNSFIKTSEIFLKD